MFKLIKYFNRRIPRQYLTTLLCGMRDQQSLRSACAYAQSDWSLCLSLEYCMTVKLLTEHRLASLSLKWGLQQLV